MKVSRGKATAKVYHHEAHIFCRPKCLPRARRTRACVSAHPFRQIATRAQLCHRPHCNRRPCRGAAWLILLLQDVVRASSERSVCECPGVPAVFVWGSCNLLSKPSLVCIVDRRITSATADSLSRNRLQCVVASRQMPSAIIFQKPTNRNNPIMRRKTLVHPSAREP